MNYHNQSQVQHTESTGWSWEWGARTLPVLAGDGRLASRRLPHTPGPLCRARAGLSGGSVHPTLYTHHLDLKHEATQVLRGGPLARSHRQLWTGSQATPQPHATSRLGPLVARRPQGMPSRARQNRSIALNPTELLGVSFIP